MDGNSKIYSKYNEMYYGYNNYFTKEELAIIKKRGVSKIGVLYVFKDARDTAIKVAIDQKWDTEEYRNGRTDAFRHSYLSTKLANKYGKDIAADIVFAHEKYQTAAGDEVEAVMDNYNNQKGLNLNEKPKILEEMIPNPNKMSSIYLDFKTPIVNMINNGELKVFRDYGDRPSTQLVNSNEI